MTSRTRSRPTRVTWRSCTQAKTPIKRAPTSSSSASRAAILEVIYDPRFADHLTGAGHPERPARLGALLEGLAAGGIARERFRSPQSASERAIASVHDERYVALVERFCEAVPELAVAELPTGDTIAGHDSFRIAQLAAGAAIDAAQIATAQAPALAVVRPPGHHAEPARGMGFCLFNNVALAAQTARTQRGATLIIDFDYHHGNGTQAWAQRVIGNGVAPLGFFSTHAYPAYPGTGAFSESRYAKEGFVIDIPLPLDTATGDFVGVWTTLLPALAKALRPKTIVVSAGFDFLQNDPIAGLPVSVEAVKLLCGLIGQTAAEQDATIAMVLEGGYDLNNLRLSAEMLARAFTQDTSRTHVPAAHEPQDKRLREMTSEVLRWLS